MFGSELSSLGRCCRPNICSNRTSSFRQFEFEQCVEQLFIRWVTASPLSTVRSLRPTFVTARLVWSLIRSMSSLQSTWTIPLNHYYRGSSYKVLIESLHNLCFSNRRSQNVWWMYHLCWFFLWQCGFRANLWSTDLAPDDGLTPVISFHFVFFGTNPA